VIEGRLQKRAAEAMYRANLNKLAEVVNDALRCGADRADGREEELRAELAKVEAKRNRLVEAIASGGEAFQSVRDRLADTEQSVATITADLERVRFEKRAARRLPRSGRGICGPTYAASTTP
jgi:chromosome segregation ATPase